MHHADSEAQRGDVHAVLADLGLGDAVEHRMVEALNKIDLIEPECRAMLQNQAQRNHDVVPISAVTGEGCDRLMDVLDSRVDSDRQLVHLEIPVSDGAALAWLYQHGEVVSRNDDEQAAHVAVRLSEADLGRFKSRRLTH